MRLEFTPDEQLQGVEMNKIFLFKLITVSDNHIYSEMALIVDLRGLDELSRVIYLE